jgi:hypothetical protein
MNIRNAILTAAAAALLAPAAFATTTATKAQDCASLQAKYEKELAANPTGAGVAKAKDLAAHGEKLCSEGKAADGEKKLHEAMKELKAKTK